MLRGESGREMKDNRIMGELQGKNRSGSGGEGGRAGFGCCSFLSSCSLICA